MSARRAARAALLAATAAGALLALAPAASADACPSVTYGPVSAGACENLTLTPTDGIGYTVQGDVDAYCEFRFITDSCAYYPPDVHLGSTGVDVNDDPPSPLDFHEQFDGTISDPERTWATVYVDGTAYSVETDAYCVSVTVRCP